MIPNFIKTDIYDYSELIKTDKIQAIFHNMPDNLTKLEQAYFVYLELGKILSENPKDVLNTAQNRISRFGTSINENFFGVCLSISELYVNILKDERIGIDCDVIKRNPIKKISHYDVVLKIDGHNYLVSLIRDLTNIKTSMRTKWFCFGIKELLEKRLSYLANLTDNMNISTETISQLIRDCISNNSTEKIDQFIEKHKNTNPKKLAIIHRHLLTTVYDYVYLGYIRDTYHSITYLEASDIEKMDLKLGYSFGSIQSENGNHKRGLYTSDVLHRMAYELSDNDVAKKYILNGAPFSNSNVLDYKLQFVIDNYSKFVEQAETFNYFEQIISFKQFAGHFINEDEFERIIFYALKTGPDEKDYTSLIKLRPYDKSGKNRFFLYSYKERKYIETLKDDLKTQFANNSGYRLVGIERTYDENLANMTSSDDIGIELSK